MIHAAKRYSALYLYISAIIGGVLWLLYLIFVLSTATPLPTRLEQVETRLNALTNEAAKK